MSREIKAILPEGGDALLAAEYVLGVQSADLRAELTTRIKNDSEFSRLVQEWEVHFSEFNSAYEPATPPRRVKTSIDKALFSSNNKGSQSLWNSLSLWRGLALGALALSALVVTPIFLRGNTTQTSPSIIAALQSTEGELSFLAFYEPGSDKIRLSKVDANKSEDRDFELWLIEADGIPQSIGIISDLRNTSVSISPAFTKKINAGDTFAISIEPLGGSPTGEVTGPVIAIGTSKSI